MVHPEAPRAALCDASGLRLAGIEPERGRIDAGLASFLEFSGLISRWYGIRRLITPQNVPQSRKTHKNKGLSSRSRRGERHPPP